MCGCRVQMTFISTIIHLLDVHSSLCSSNSAKWEIMLVGAVCFCTPCSFGFFFSFFSKHTFAAFSFSIQNGNDNTFDAAVYRSMNVCINYTWIVVVLPPLLWYFARRYGNQIRNEQNEGSHREKNTKKNENVNQDIPIFSNVDYIAVTYLGLTNYSHNQT